MINPNGAIAQLGERNTGSVEVGGSIPPSSTISYPNTILFAENNRTFKII